MSKRTKAIYFGLCKAVVPLTFMISCTEEGGFSTANISPETFITTWNNTTTVMIPTDNTLLYNYDVDWDNDGTFDEIGITGNASHTFSTSEPHTVGIRGQFPAIQFGVVSEDGNSVTAFDRNINRKIVAVNQWGNIAWSSMAGAFAFCNNVTFPATDVPDLSAVSNTSFMFSNATAANPDVRQWKVSNVENMRRMFSRARSANPDVSQWDVSNVTDMSGMFASAKIATPNVTQWNVSSVTNMSSMFASAEVAKPNVSHWKVSNVEFMDNMFIEALSANPIVSDWNVSNVTDMSFMFSGARSANPNVSEWEVSKVRNMRGMFGSRLPNTSAANPNLSGWRIPEVTDMSFIFDNSQMSPKNYAAALLNFAEQSTQHGVSLGASAINFCDNLAVQAAKDTLIVAREWSITDAGPVNCTTP